jgi:4a-hydroxytetrahydrobiopterin dehydratase
MNGLAKLKCVPCRVGTPALRGKELEIWRQQLDAGWQVADEHHLEKQFDFPDFRLALAFTNQVGELAENEGHHPDILLGWGKVRITLFTHKVNGLTESDFILAAKIQSLLPEKPARAPRKKTEMLVGSAA